MRGWLRPSPWRTPLLLHRRGDRHGHRRSFGDRADGDNRHAVADHPSLLLPVGALIMLAGIYYAREYGGSTTAILVNLPGEASSVVTTLDGYQLAQQGKAGTALSVAAVGSFFAGLAGIATTVLFGPLLTAMALKLQPGITARSWRWAWSRRSSCVGLGHQGDRHVILGLLVGVVGTDLNDGVQAHDVWPAGLWTASIHADRYGLVRHCRDRRQSRNGA